MNIERLFRIHEMIEWEKTGTPADFAQKFNIKTKQLQNQIEELRLCGANVKYSRKRKTYFYAERFDFFGNIDYQHIVRTMSKKIFRDLLKFFLEKNNNWKEKK